MKLKLIAVMAFVGVLCISCTETKVIESGEQEASIPKEDVKEKEVDLDKIDLNKFSRAIVESDEVVPGDEIQSRYAYDKDWESIKEAIISKDKAKIKNWSSDRIDPENILLVFGDPDVMKALKKSNYSDLKPEEQEGEVMLVFYFEQAGSDDEGNEMGMSITLYLKQGDPNLTLEYMIAAG